MGSLKFELIRRALEHTPSLNLSALCRVAGVSRSGYYHHVSSFSNKLVRDKFAVEVITKAFEKSRRRAGIITLEMSLRAQGLVINHKKIARIKRQHGLHTLIRKRNPYRDIPLKSKEHRTIPNLLKRDFYPPLPNQIFSTDMTYLFYGNCERAYLSATKDLCTNEIVSFKLMRRPNIDSFVAEFEGLIKNIPKNRRAELIIHSDQGFQYTHPKFQSTLKIAGIRQSMSRRGNCLDNAPIESFFGHLKDSLELKKCGSYEDVNKEVERCMRFYNYERPQKALNKKPPAEYRGLFSGFY